MEQKKRGEEREPLTNIMVRERVCVCARVPEEFYPEAAPAAATTTGMKSPALTIESDANVTTTL